MAETTKLVQNIQELAQTVGRDIKAIKTQVATKEELSVVASKIPKGSGIPTFDFSVESNGDVLC